MSIAPPNKLPLFGRSGNSIGQAQTTATDPERPVHTLAADGSFVVQAALALRHAIALLVVTLHSVESSITLLLRAAFHHVLKVSRNASHHA